MSFHELILWALLGGLTAFLILKSQEWSVAFVSPEKQKQSLILILGGTLVRWATISGVFVFAFTHAFLAGLIVFGTFLFFRMIFLLKWQGWLPGRKTL